jgi:hypothetical protein
MSFQGAKRGRAKYVPLHDPDAIGPAVEVNRVVGISRKRIKFKRGMTRSIVRSDS